ncbi:putative CTD kinase subunit alpha like protein, partial [Dictyocoela roeselum]
EGKHEEMYLFDRGDEDDMYYKKKPNNGTEYDIRSESGDSFLLKSNNIDKLDDICSSYSKENHGKGYRKDGFSPKENKKEISNPPQYTAGLVTLWYRPPEMLFGSRYYDEKIDIWGVGCIFAEILFRKPIFQGADEYDQLLKIISVCGTINERTLPGVSNHPVYNEYKLPQGPNRISYVFRGFDPLSADLIGKLLCIDPRKRISGEKAVEHKFFECFKRRMPDTLKSKRVFSEK